MRDKERLLQPRSAKSLREKEKKLAAIARWKASPIKFLKDLFPHHFGKEFSWFHKEIFKELGIQKGGKLVRTPRIAIAAPRKHGKSEVITFGWLMYNLLLNDDNNLTLIIANNYNNAVKFLVPIKEELEHNELIKYIWGELKSQKWSENEIELTSKKKVICGGNEFKIRGVKYLQHRPDLVIVDDAEDDELVRSDRRRDDFEHWLIYGVEPAMTQESNQIVFVGTILHRASQLSMLQMAEGRYRDWRKLFYTALVEGGSKALWEDGVPYKWLLEEKDKDPYKFAQEYMNNPVPNEHGMFKEEYFDNYEDSDTPEHLVVNITVDLACSDREYSDYTVILPCGIDVNGDGWILPYKRSRYTDPDVIIRTIIDEVLKYKKSKKWKFGKLGIEKNGFQRFLIKNFYRECKRRGIVIPVYEIQAKGDKVQRISQLQPWFASGDLHIRMSMLDLKQELLDFPRSLHDDIADSLAFQLEFVQRKATMKKIKDTHWHVTPDMQRNKILQKRRKELKPKTYTRFQGVA